MINSLHARLQEGRFRHPITGGLSARMVEKPNGLQSGVRLLPISLTLAGVKHPFRQFTVLNTEEGAKIRHIATENLEP